MNIYDAIRDDHDRMRGLLRELKKAVEDGGDAPGRLFDELKRQLRSHEAAEETAFYEPLKRADETRREVLEGLTEHQLIDTLGKELEVTPTDSESWAAKLQVLGELLEHHMKEEEDELFGEARKVLDDQEAARLGEAWLRRKRDALDAVAPVKGR